MQHYSLYRGKTPELQTLFPAKQPREQGEDNADDNAGCNGKIETEAFLLDGDVSGHSSNKGNLAAEHKQSACNNQNNADNYQHLAKGIEFTHIFCIITGRSQLLLATGHKHTVVHCQSPSGDGSYRILDSSENVTIHFVKQSVTELLPFDAYPSTTAIVTPRAI